MPARTPAENASTTEDHAKACASNDAMNIHGLAKYLGVSHRTIEEWEAKNDAPPRMPLPGRAKRWSPRDVDEWLAQRREAQRMAATG